MLTCIIKRMWQTRDIWLTVTFLGISVYGLVLLRQMRETRYMQSSNARAALTVGQRLSNLMGEDLGGHEMSIVWASDKRPSLVYLFRESCVWCSRNMANIRSLAAVAAPEYRVIGVALSDTQLRDYVVQNGMRFPIYKNVKTADGNLFEADGTPETLLVSSSGIITQRWLGAYVNGNQKQIEQAFRTHLPGLAPEASFEKSSIIGPAVAETNIPKHPN